MTKEQFINKWPYLNDTRDTINPYFISDLEAVIANEIAKVQEANPQPALNPIEQAYELGEKISRKNWMKSCWIKKYSVMESIDERGNILVNDWNFVKHPNKWELYTEPTEQPAQPSSQAKLDNSFDKERFEAMFRAVVASGEYKGKEFDKTAESLSQLDAYYATKEGGANG